MKKICKLSVVLATASLACLCFLVGCSHGGDKSYQTQSSQEVNIYAGENMMTMQLYDTVAAKALLTELYNGDITVDMHDYGGFEKVGSLGKNYPSKNSEITTEAGDVVLYSGNQIVIFYGSNGWNYTRFGKIKDATAQDIKDFLGSGDITIRLSLD